MFVAKWALLLILNHIKMSTLIIASICFIGYSVLIYWIVKDAGYEDEWGEYV